MDIKRFGNRQGKTIMLLHGNLMCWRQFENLIPLLEKKFCVYAVSFDGFDGTGETTYTTAQAQADKLAGYIEKELDGRLDLLYAESLNCLCFLQKVHRAEFGRETLCATPETSGRNTMLFCSSFRIKRRLLTA